MMKSIQTDQEYSDVLARIYELIHIDDKEESIISDELEKLSDLVKNYELIHYPL